jgi:hypothetical protein
MHLYKRFVRLASFSLLGLLAFSQVHAQATRTWISGVGDDANPCSRTAPCKTFTGAIARTASGGVIDTLDPGGFGGVTITKSITLESSNGASGILVSGVNGIIVNGAGVVVVLRGLSLEGLGTGLAGIKFLNGSQLVVDRCDIGNFRGGSSAGIAFTPSGAATLIVRDSTIHDNGGAFDTGDPENSTLQSAGILVAPTGTGSASVVLDNVHLVNESSNGLQVYGPANVAVKNSTIAGNPNHGIWAIGLDTGGAQPQNVSMTLDNVDASGSTNGVAAIGHASVGINYGTIANNSQNGILASGDNASDAVTLHVHGTFVNNNGLNGVLVQGDSHDVDANLDDVFVGGNPQSGVSAQGSHAHVVLSGSTVTGSVQGLRANGGASLVSFGNNRLYGNTVNGAPTATSALQ